MTRTHRKHCAAVLLITVLTSTAVLTPATAGGMFSMTVTPRSQEQAQAVRFGMQMFSMIEGGRRSGSIGQHGHNNNAGLAQSGGGNHGLIHQKGDEHSATLQQRGGGNSHGIFQFGRGAKANVLQRGDQTGATFQFGW